MSLQGQVALVIGGARGIGLSTVQHLLKEGANVTVSDVSAAGEQLVKALQGEFGAQRCIFVKADVRSEDQLEAAFMKTKSHFKKLDIVVNVAGIVNDRDWETEVDINLNGTVRTVLLAWKHMGKHEGGNGGVVINTSSFVALKIQPITPIYTATKLGIIGLTRSGGDQFHVDRTGVKLMVICPGQTDTPIFQELTFLSEEITKHFSKVTTETIIQSADNVAKGIVHMIHNGSSGSVWMSEEEKPVYQVKYPYYQDMRTDQ